MELNLLFNLTLTLLILVLILCVIKKGLDVFLLKRKIDKDFFKLQKSILVEEEKLTNSLQNLKLVDELKEALFNKLFKIINDIVLLQKIILKEYSN